MVGVDGQKIFEIAKKWLIYQNIPFNDVTIFPFFAKNTRFMAMQLKFERTTPSMCLISFVSSSPTMWVVLNRILKYFK